MFTRGVLQAPAAAAVWAVGGLLWSAVVALQGPSSLHRRAADRLQQGLNGAFHIDRISGAQRRAFGEEALDQLGQDPIQHDQHPPVVGVQGLYPIPERLGQGRQPLT